MGKKIIGVDSIAKEANRSVNTVQRWIDLDEPEKSPIKEDKNGVYFVDEDELKAWLVRIKSYKIESLDRIGVYFGVGKKTIDRWRKKGLPLYKIGRYLTGYIDEMDLWYERVKEPNEKPKLKSQTATKLVENGKLDEFSENNQGNNNGFNQDKEIAPSPEEPENGGRQPEQGELQDEKVSVAFNNKEEKKGESNVKTEKKYSSLLNFKSVFVISVALFSILFLIFRVKVLAMKNSSKGGEIIVKASVDGSLVKLQAFIEGNEKDSLTFYYRFTNEISARNRINYPAEKPQFYATGDFNGDSLKDLIVINPGERNGVIVYLQKDNKLVFKEKKSFLFSHSFGKSDYRIDDIRYLQCGDLNKDGRDEIIVLMSNSDVFPACVLVLDEQLNKKGIIYHPGWFRSAVVKDLNHDGKNELYVSGTNNDLVNFSEEIVFGIEGDFNKKFEFDLFPYNEGLKENLKNFKIVYARLNYSDWLDTTYQLALINNLNNYPDKLIVTGAIAQYWGKGDIVVQTWIKTFSFGYLLKLKKAWIFDTPLKYKKISLSQDEVKKALTPHYWNGKTWQDNWCLIQ